MLKPIPVILSLYDPRWPQRAADYAEQLTIIGPCLVKVHHVGSTSVPGLSAKPIIDLLPVVTDLQALDQNRQHVEALGFQWHGEYGIGGRRYCTLSNAMDLRIAQLHFFQVGSAQITRHLAFRDYLRSHSGEAQAYSEEKLRARTLHPDDSYAYSKEKSAWIEQTLTKALKWYTPPLTNQQS